MHALITGASGFIGSHLAQALVERGDRVSGLVRCQKRCEHLRGLGVNCVRGDVTDPASLSHAVDDVDVVFHLAGRVKAFGYSEFLDVNERGVHNVAQACAARRNPPVLVVVSSLAAAGPAPAGRARTEDDPPTPVSNYGRSKRAGELAAESWADRVPITIVRPPLVFGERDASTLDLVRPIVLGGIHPTPPLADQRMSLIHAADLVQALVAAAERGERLEPRAEGAGYSPRGYYYAASDDQPTYADIGRMIGQAVGRKRVRVVRPPRFVFWCVAAASEAVARLRRAPMIFNIDKVREAFAGSWICSNERARRELGFSVRASLLERWRQTTEWCTHHHVIN